MTIQFFCTHWGGGGMPFHLFAEKAKAAGYDGVEIVVPANDFGKQHIQYVLQQHGLLLIAQTAQANDKSFDENSAAAEQMIMHAASLNPVKINSQTGKDYYSFVQNMHFIQLYHRLQEQTGISIVHEMHRGRFNYSPFVAQEYFNSARFAVTADFSHWCCVTESLLQAEQWQQTIQQVIERSTHIHARVGFAEGPQVNDPRAPENKAALDAHLYWWDAIVEQQRKNNVFMMTITPEFGPVPYMPAQPYTHEPLVNQWEVNVWMMNMLRKRYT
jgi:hypothetical protein